MDDLLAEFVTETAESLGELDSALLMLEQTPGDLPTIARIFRLVHTIKGTCGFLGLTRLERVAHAAENLLGLLRDGKMTATADVVSMILRGLDRLKLILDGIGASGGEPAGDDSDLIAAFARAAEAPAAAPLQAAEVTSAGPPSANKTHDESGGRAAEPVAPAVAAERAGEGEHHAAGAQSIRVSVDVLEELMTLVGELVLTRNQLMQIDRTEHNAAYVVPLQRLSHITTDLQEGVMKTRMQPIGNAWNKLPRLVRDLGHELGKSIELVTLGTATELDRQVLELIRDPLTHMVRNSADHGLESAAERRAAGKPETGRITLNAYHEGGHIVIEVSDDGRGLQVERIRSRALERGLAPEAELLAMSDADIQRFIFHPGFSTATTVTAISGRGVGMDVVRTNIEKIGGTIDVRSDPGGGTLFAIKIPLTLAIVSALIIAAGGERFAVPQISVVELVRTRPDAHTAAQHGEPAIERIDDTPVLRLRNHLLPLVNLAELLQLPPTRTGPGEFLHVVVAQIGANLLGLIVDQVFDTEEIVVKPVAPILRHLTLFSGNTILGDGAVIMILDPNGIARTLGVGASGFSEKSPTAPSAKPQTSSDRNPMLLFRAGDERRMAVPLGLVSRLEDISADQIEAAGEGLLTHYRGRLMPLIPMAPARRAGPDRAPASRPVLVFSDRGRTVGLIVDEIIDVVEERLQIELTADQPGVLGIAVIAGHATHVIDIAHWLTRAYQDWFGSRTNRRGHQVRVLVVEDDDFFRQLLMPTLAANGFGVTAAAGGHQALRLRDAGEQFDMIISDIEMPDMDGLQFARDVRAGGAWSGVPLIALTGRRVPGDVEAAQAAGFSACLSKSDRDALIETLQRYLAMPVAA